MKFGYPQDFAVRVRKQEEDEERSVSRFYRGIYSVSLNFLVHIMFIPPFSHRGKRWALDIPDDIDEVHSVQEARLFTAALSEITVTPDNSRAGQEQLIALAAPLSPVADMATRQGVIFYVTPEQFALFTQELAELAEQTFSIYGFFPVSKLEHLESIKFITNKIIRSHYFSEKNLKIIGQQKEISNGFRAGYAHQVNRWPIHKKRSSEPVKDVVWGEEKVLSLVPF